MPDSQKRRCRPWPGAALRKSSVVEHNEISGSDAVSQLLDDASTEEVRAENCPLHPGLGTPWTAICDALLARGNLDDISADFVREMRRITESAHPGQMDARCLMALHSRLTPE